jgi:hypothetical protein
MIRVPATLAAPPPVPLAAPPLPAASAPPGNPFSHDALTGPSGQPSVGGRTASKNAYWCLTTEAPPNTPEEKLRVELPRNLPPEIAALGAPVERFGRWVPMVGVIVGVVMALTGLGMMIAVPFLSFKYNWIGVPGFFILIGGIVVAIRAWLDVGRKIFLYREGFVCVGHGKPVLRRWEDIAAVFQDIQEVRSEGNAGFTHSYRVQYRNGDSQTLDDNSASDAKALGDAILFETTRRLLPQYRQALAQGGAIPFGPLRLSREGLIGERGMLRWEHLADISLVEVARGAGKTTYYWRVLRIENQVMVRAVWEEVPLQAIPNPHVFLALVGERVPAIWQ